MIILASIWILVGLSCAAYDYLDGETGSVVFVANFVACPILVALMILLLPWMAMGWACKRWRGGVH